MPYERSVAADRPAACRSANHSATAVTTVPSGPTSRYGSVALPVSISDPAAGTTSPARSRIASPSSITVSDHSAPASKTRCDLRKHLL